jgi:hypothetical protein
MGLLHDGTCFQSGFSKARVIPKVWNWVPTEKNGTQETERTGVAELFLSGKAGKIGERKRTLRAAFLQELHGVAKSITACGFAFAVGVFSL